MPLQSIEYPKDPLYPLFDHMLNTHELTLLDSELHEIVSVVNSIQKEEPEKAYTIDDLVAERERAMKICQSFFKKYTESFESRTRAEQSVYGIIKPQSVAWVDQERAEVARYCANAISGRTGLNLDTPLKELVLEDLKTHHEKHS